MTDSTASPNQPLNETPLQGWKEIAAYLDRDVRTAQRWEESTGLPVRRHGSSTGSVYAYPSEIEKWRGSQPTKTRPQSAGSRPLGRRRLVPAVAVGGAAIAALLIVLYGPVLNPPFPRAEAAQNGVSTEVIWDQAAGISTQGSISPDGRFLTYVDWHDEGNLAVRNLATGENRRLTDDADGATLFLGTFSYAGESRISPDGTQAAYTWATRLDLQAVETGEIRVLPLDSRSEKPRVVWHPAEGSWVGVHDWFPDGDRVAAVVSASPTEHRIVTVSVASGAVRQIRSLPWSDWPQVRVSPSGRYIAYSRSASQEDPARDIYIVTVDGSAETAVVRHAARDELVDWGRDDGTLLVNSDRDGQPGLWTVPLQDGKPAGPLELAMPNVDVAAGVGLSDDGSLYYPVRVSRRRLKLAELDPETGKLLSKPRDAAERFLGRNSNGVFSPDGKTFAYLSAREGWNQRAIVMRSLSNGQEHDVANELRSVYSLLWGPAADCLLVQGRDDRGRYGYFEVSLADGHATLIAEASWAGVLSSDGERLLHRTNQVGEKELRTYRFSDGSYETLRGDFGTGRFGVSPDGRIATVHDRAEIRIHPAEGGEPAVLWRTDPDKPLGRWVVWTADGKTLLILRSDPDAGEEMWRLWAVPADGSPPYPTELVHDLANAGAWPLRLHPDGKTLLYVEGGYFWQIWSMRNLPAAGEVQRSH